MSRLSRMRAYKRIAQLETAVESLSALEERQARISKLEGVVSTAVETLDEKSKPRELTDADVITIRRDRVNVTTAPINSR